jgi:FHS family L-fucose permease-like MFS transporter
MAMPAINKPVQPISGASNRKFLFPFILVTTLFFLWGFANNLDSVLIPHLRKACQLNNRMSMLVDTAVYLAYFLMPIPAGMILKKYGYKAGIITGLLLFAFGAFLFVPAANTRLFSVFIIGLFIIGLGLAMLETAANPYATILGSPETSTARLNLAQSFNGLAAMAAPFIGSTFILSGKEYSPAQMTAMTDVDRISYLSSEAATVKVPYIILGIVLLIVAVSFVFIKLPEIVEDEHDSLSIGKFFGAFKHDNLKWGVIAQFFYVGAQVCVTSIFIRTAIKAAGLDEVTAGKYYLGLGYGLAFMVGRFVGTALMKKILPKKLLAIYAFINVLLCFIAIFASGMVVVYALVAIGFFMSIMFPTIFSLGIQGLGSDTKPGSSLLVMSIVGGAIIPFFMGLVIDWAGDNIGMGYIIPLLCFVVVLYFALRKQTITVSQLEVEFNEVAHPNH